jgi:hypothetical protein
MTLRKNAGTVTTDGAQPDLVGVGFHGGIVPTATAMT